MARPERFELPTYCSGVILGHVGPIGREVQPVGNTNEVDSSNQPVLKTVS
jgi:hypothetical protein